MGHRSPAITDGLDRGWKARGVEVVIPPAVLSVWMILLATFGTTDSQVDSLSCTDFCLMGQTTCTCVVTENSLEWEVTGIDEGGGRTLDLEEDLNTYVTLLGLSAFGAILTNDSNGTLTATLNFTTLMEYEEAMITCDTSSSIASSISVHIPGPPSQPTNISFFDPENNTCYQLAWDTPNDTSDCVSHYLVNTTTSDVLLNTIDTSVPITRPPEGPTNVTYSVSVAAVDMDNRTGQWSDPLCYLFQVPSVVISDTSYHDCSTGSFHIVWHVMPSACYPFVDHVFVSLNDTTLMMHNNGTYTLSPVQLGDEYKIEIVPGGALGNGSATTTIINIPDSCSMTSSRLPSSTPQPSTNLFITPSNSSTPMPTVISCEACLVIGAIVAIVAITLLIMAVVSVLIVYIIYRKKKRKARIIAIMPGKEDGHSSDKFNSETESAEHPQAYESPSYAKREYCQLKQSEIPPKSEYASPQDAHQTTSTQQQAPTQVPMYQEIDQLGKRECHLQATGGSLAQEKRSTVTLNRSEITDTEGYSDLPAHSKKSSATKTSTAKGQYADVEFTTTSVPCPYSQDTVEYTSVQPGHPIPEYAAVQKRKGKEL